MPGNYLALPHLSQEQPFTCTPACVRMVLAYHGRDLPERDIALRLDTDDTGTRFRNIANVASLGCRVHFGTGTLADLQAVSGSGMPLIARIKTMHLPRYPLPPWVRHSVVVVGATAAEVYIHDPAQHTGPDVVPAHNFDAAWQAGKHQFALLTPP